MENQELSPHAGVLSRSALHAFITGPAMASGAPKSNFNPYRKRTGLLSLMSLERVEEVLTEAVEERQSQEDRQESTPSSSLPLKELPSMG